MVTKVFDKNVIFEDLFYLLDKPIWLTYSDDITAIMNKHADSIIINYDLVYSAKNNGANINSSADYVNYIINVCNKHYNERLNSVSQKMTPMSEQKLLSIIYGVSSNAIKEYYSKTYKGRVGFNGLKYIKNFTMKDAAMAVMRRKQFLEYAHNPENGIYCTYSGCRAEKLYDELCFSGLDFWELVDRIKSDRLCNWQFVSNVKRLCNEYKLRENVIMAELSRNPNCSLEDAILKYVNRRNNNISYKNI